MIRDLKLSDLGFALSLSRRAGWNQLEADWRRCLDLAPDGCFLAEQDGQPAGTTTTCTFGAAAWIGMVLVEPELRNRGIGRALMEHALRRLDACGVDSVWLDATPLGKPLYEKLGFITEATILRRAGVARGIDSPGNVDACRPDDLPAIIDLDRGVLGYDRAPLLRSLPIEHARVLRRGQAATAACLARPGANAWQVGPCLAANAAEGERLLADALARFAGQRVHCDVPESHAAAHALLVRAGLEVQRPLFRMRLGRPIPWSPGNIWSTFGPEKG